MIDSVLLGAWTAALLSHLWVTVVLLSAMALNHAVIGGLRQMALGSAIFIAASVLWARFVDLRFVPFYEIWFAAYMAVMMYADKAGFHAAMGTDR